MKAIYLAVALALGMACAAQASDRADAIKVEKLAKEYRAFHFHECLPAMLEQDGIDIEDKEAVLHWERSRQAHSKFYMRIVGEGQYSYAEKFFNAAQPVRRAWLEQRLSDCKKYDLVTYVNAGIYIVFGDGK